MNDLLVSEIEIVDEPLPSIIDRCVELVSEGVTVVTETQRLKHLVEDAYNLKQFAKGKVSWATPKVATWDVWLRNLWHEREQLGGDNIRQLLSSGQSSQVWEDTISKNIREEYKEDFEYLLWHITATASSAKLAYGLTKSYGIKASDFDEPMSEDAQHFLGWLESYRSVLKKRHWIDQESLADEFIENVELIQQCTDCVIAFVGFDKWHPQQQRLYDALSANGVHTTVLDHLMVREPERVDQFQFDKAEDEITACARWARAVIELNPEVHRVGIVIPRFGELYRRIQRIFSAILNPDAIMEDRQTHNMSFHVTRGMALGETPLVVDALNLIELIKPEVEISLMCAVIRSDRIKGWDTESSARSSLAAKLPGVGGHRISIARVLKIIEGKSIRCPRLVKLLENAEKMRSESPEFVEYGYWGQFFTEWMADFQDVKREGRIFGADEKQALESWGSIISDLVELGCVSSSASVYTAIAKVTRMVSEQSFQPRAVRVPVQIGEMIAMSGQTFTHMWMLSMNNEVLPGSPRPNPFIPIALQKSLELPSSSPSMVQKEITQRIDRLLSSATHIVQSYSTSDGSQHFQPSSLLNRAQAVELADFGGEQYVDYVTQISGLHDQCEDYQDWKAVSIASPQDVRSGSSILRSQSMCSFRGFAGYRLKAKRLDDFELGISPLDRGTLVHDLFEHLYKKIPSSDELILSMHDENFLNEARVIARQVVDKFNSKRVRSFDSNVLDNEVDRMVDLAGQWYSSDVEREPFNVLHAELEIATSIATLPVRIRIDRIDQVEDGLVVIDYKTGNCSLKDLEGERPRDPQLLIYACALSGEGHDVRDVAYAKVKRGEIKFWEKLKRYSALERAQIIRGWTKTLEKIASDFLVGIANVDPQKGACDYCEFGPICRIKEIDDLEGRRDRW